MCELTSVEKHGAKACKESASLTSSDTLVPHMKGLVVWVVKDFLYSLAFFFVSIIKATISQPPP